MNTHWKQMYVALKNISEKSTMYALTDCIFCKKSQKLYYKNVAMQTTHPYLECQTLLAF